MAYKSLTTIISSPQEAKAALPSAAHLAVALDAHLDVLALGIDRTQLGYSYLGSGAVLMQVAMERAEQDARGWKPAQPRQRRRGLRIKTSWAGPAANGHRQPPGLRRRRADSSHVPL